MNRKRNVNYTKPEDPEFLKILKKQAGYDDRNHKFDQLECSDNDFVEDGDDEQPQVVVLKKGDLTAKEAEEEMRNIEKIESETKADLSQKVIFKSKPNSKDSSISNKRKHEEDKNAKSSRNTKKKSILSFADEEEDNDSN